MSHDQNSDQSTPNPHEAPWRSCGGFDARYKGSEVLNVRSVPVVTRIADNWRKRMRGQQVEMVMFRG